MTAMSADAGHPVHVLPARQATEGDVLWLEGDALAILDPHLAQQVNAANFADLTLPRHRLAAWLRPGRGRPVSWTSVRARAGATRGALCHLMCTRYRVEVARPGDITIGLRSGPVPMNFRGRIIRRAHPSGAGAGALR